MLLFKRESDGSYTVAVPAWGNYRVWSSTGTVLSPGQVVTRLEDIYFAQGTYWNAEFTPAANPGIVTCAVEIFREVEDDDGPGESTKDRAIRAVHDHYKVTERERKWAEFMANHDPHDLYQHVHGTHPQAGLTGPGVPK